MINKELNEKAISATYRYVSVTKVPKDIFRTRLLLCVYTVSQKTSPFLYLI